MSVIVSYGMKSILFWGDLTMWLYFPVKNLSHSEGTWLCDHNFQPKIYPILRGPDYVIILSSQKPILIWVHLTMWLYLTAKNLSHSEGTWLSDYTFQPKIYPILRGPDYVIILSAKKTIPFWKNLSMWLWFPAKKLTQSEGTWLGDCILRNGIYPILGGHDYVIIISSQKSIPFWGDLTIWLYFPAKNLSHSEGTWLYDCILRNEFYRILREPDYVIILTSLKSIPFWGELTRWLQFPVKNLSPSEGTCVWL